MWRTVRRVDVAKSWKRAKQVYAAVVSERDVLKAECEMLERENEALGAALAEARARINELRANICARYECWDELATLHREAQIERAQKAERMPATLLH